MIILEHVTKAFSNNLVLDDLSIEFEAGKSYAITGYNGCGKSVLLKVICGFSKPTAGRVFVDGQEIGRQIDFIQNAGISINAPEFINSMTGLENLLALASIRKKIGKEQILQTVAQLELEPFIHQKVKTYSLGTKQRLRLAQAMMEQPQILILDEPMNALDQKMVEWVTRLLNQFVQQGKTLLFTSHHAQDIDTLASDIYEFDQRKLRRVC